MAFQGLLFFWRSSERSEEKREVWIFLVGTLNRGEVALLVFENQVQEKQVYIFDKHFGPLQPLSTAIHFVNSACSARGAKSGG